MKLYYHREPGGNFGDDLNAWLWPKLIPDLLEDDDETLFVGIGTILNHRIPDPPHKIVFGTGVGYGSLPDVDDRWEVYCVRGPLSAEALRMPRAMALTDPALLVRDLLPQEKRPVCDAVSLMPHHVTVQRAIEEGIDLEAACDAAGVSFIDPSEPVEAVLRGIQRSDLVIAGAMHAAIVADALRVPWIPVQLYDHIFEFKWRDWCASMCLDYSPVVRYPKRHQSPTAGLIDFIDGVRSDVRTMLSNDHTVRDRTQQLRNCLEQLRVDHGRR